MFKYFLMADMHQYAYRIDNFPKLFRCLKPGRFLLIGAAFIGLLFSGCSKDDNAQLPPKIRLLNQSGMIESDTSIAVGQLMSFVIAAESGSSNLTNLIAIQQDGNGNKQRALDTSMNSPRFSVVKTFTKNLDKKEFWTFIIRDKNRLSDSVSVTIALDTTSGFGPITYYDALIISAQNNPNPGSFFSFISEETYSLEAASLNQELIDLVFYFGEDEHTMASPGANIEDGIFNPSPGDWQIRRTIRYIAIDLPPGAFEEAQNDSLLIGSYTQGDGKRKAKYLQAGSTFSFQTQNLKYGIFRVKEVEGTEAGRVTVDIKIQKE